MALDRRNPLESSRAPSKGGQSIVRPSERKIHYAPRERKRYFDVIQRYFAAIQFQSSKASETNGPIFERQRNYKRLSVTRLFLSYPSPLLSPSFHLFLGVTLVIETLHSKEILASFRRNEVKKRVVRGSKTRRTRAKKELHRLIRKERKGSIPSSFSFLPPLFGPSSPSKVRILVSGRGKLAHAIL